jgi:hypothetical protein
MHHRSRRAVLTVLAGAAASPASAALMQPDPIFTAIEAHREAWDRMQETWNADDPDIYAEYDEAAADLALDSEVEALQALAETRPTTAAGAAALLAYLSTSEAVPPARQIDAFDWQSVAGNIAAVLCA